MQIHLPRLDSPLGSELGSPQLLYACKLDERDLLYPRSAHAHADVVEFVYILSGEGEYEIANVRYPVQAGDLVIYNSGVVHHEFDKKQKIPILCCAATGIALPNMQPNCIVPPRMKPVFHLGDRCHVFRHLMQAIFDEALLSEAHAAESCQALFLSLLYLVLDRIQTNIAANGENEPSCNPLGTDIRAYVDALPVSEVSIPQVARAFDISASYLARVFKRSFGYSLTTYLIQRRIGEAQTLLLTTELPIIEIARRIGYDNQSYFTKVFTQHIGLSPLRYRKMYQKTLVSVEEKGAAV